MEKRDINFEATLTDEMLRELYNDIFRKNRILNCVFILIGVVSLVLFFTIWGYDVFWLIYGIVMIGAGFGLFAYLKKRVNALVDTYFSVNGANIKTEFYEDYLTSGSERSAGKYLYKDMFKAKERENYWIVYIGNKKAPMMLFFPKEGFKDAPSYDNFVKLVTEAVPADKIKRL